MNRNSQSGSGSASAFFAILFLASVALNAAFLTGCISMDDIRGGKEKPIPTTTAHRNSAEDEAFYLREIAASLGLSPSSEKTPGDIAFDIKQALANTLKYRDDILSDEAFEECRAAIPTTKDTENFEAYHRFIQKVAGKKLVILDNRMEPDR